MMPTISVIMPVHDKHHTLAAAGECLAAQREIAHEVIVIDDASRDGSSEWLAACAPAQGWTLLRRDVPGPGGYAARNLGAQHARGEWLVFFDADDWLAPDHLARFAAAIAATPGPSLFVNAYQKVATGRVPASVVASPSGVLTREQALAAFARADLIHMNGACIRRDVFLALGGFPAGRYRRGGDVYFWLKALCALEAIHYDPTVTSHWRLDHSGITRDPGNLAAVHPCADLLDEPLPKLSPRERHLLCVAINRKVLAWAVARRRAGASLEDALAMLQPRHLTPRLWLQGLSLLLPPTLFRRLRAALA